MITGDNPLTACHVASQLRLISKKYALVLTKNESTDFDSEWCWQSVINDNIKKPLKYALEQTNYLKPSKGMTGEEISVYNYLCLTGEVEIFLYILLLIQNIINNFKIGIRIFTKTPNVFT
jgi:magnesium-transporting ATPase (P-type)